MAVLLALLYFIIMVFQVVVFLKSNKEDMKKHPTFYDFTYVVCFIILVIEVLCYLYIFCTFRDKSTQEFMCFVFGIPCLPITIFNVYFMAKYSKFKNLNDIQNNK